MTNSTQLSCGAESTQIPLGAKLQSARETMRLDRKDAAAQLRLNESIIDMIETNSFPESMPPIFVRGYIRAYGRLLQIPDDIIQAGLEPIKPIPETLAPQTPPADLPAKTSAAPSMLINSKNLMKIISAGVAITLLSLVIAWWAGHSTKPALATIARNNTSADTIIMPAGISVQSTNLTAPVTAAAAQQTTIAPLAPVNAAQGSNAVNTPPAGNIAAANNTAVTVAGNQSTASSPAVPAYKRAAMVSHAPETKNNKSQQAMSPD